MMLTFAPKLTDRLRRKERLAATSFDCAADADVVLNRGSSIRSCKALIRNCVGSVVEVSNCTKKLPLSWGIYIFVQVTENYTITGCRGSSRHTLGQVVEVKSQTTSPCICAKELRFELAARECTDSADVYTYINGAYWVQNS